MRDLGDATRDKAIAHMAAQRPGDPEYADWPEGTCKCGEDIHEGACEDIPVSVHAPCQYGEAS